MSISHNKPAFAITYLALMDDYFWRRTSIVYAKYVKSKIHFAICFRWTLRLGNTHFYPPNFGQLKPYIWSL